MFWGTIGTGTPCFHSFSSFLLALVMYNKEKGDEIVWLLLAANADARECWNKDMWAQIGFSLIYTFLLVEIRNSALPLTGFLCFAFNFQCVGFFVLLHVSAAASLCFYQLFTLCPLCRSELSLGHCLMIRPFSLLLL